MAGAVALTQAGKSEIDRIAEGERILTDRNAGMMASEMCAKYGISKATLYRRIDDALTARCVPTVAKYREQQNHLLDDIMKRWEAQVAGADAMIFEGAEKESMALVERGMKLRAEALNGILRVAERRARLMGTDAPVKVDVTTRDETPSIDARVAELAAEIKARAAGEAVSA